MRSINIGAERMNKGQSHRKGSKLVSIAAALVASALGGTALAQTVYTYTSSFTNRPWSESGRWDVAGYPSAPGDTAIIFPNSTAAGDNVALIDVNNAIVGTLVINKPLNGGNVVIGAGGLEASNAFTFATVSGPARINMLGSNTASTLEFRNTVVMQGGTTALVIDQASTSQIVFNAPLVGNGGNSLTVLGGSTSNYTDALRFLRPVTGFSTFTLGGTSRVAIRNRAGVELGSLNTGTNTWVVNQNSVAGFDIPAPVTVSASGGTAIALTGIGLAGAATPTSGAGAADRGFTLHLAGANQIQGATTVTGATLVLNYGTPPAYGTAGFTAQANNKIDPLSPLRLDGGMVRVDGGTFTQVVSGLNVGSGTSVVVAAGSTLSVSSGAINRVGGTNGLVVVPTSNFVLTGAVSGTPLPTYVLTSGGNQFAQAGAAGVVANLGTSSLPTSGGNVTGNYSASGATTLSGDVDFRTLRVATGSTQNVGGSNLRGGALLFDNAGGAATISGTGSVGPSSGEFIVVAANNAIQHNINAAISGGTTLLTKGGPGAVILNNTAAPYNGNVNLVGGSLNLGAGVPVPAGNILFSGGALGTSGTFTRAIGGGAGEVSFGPGGGGLSAVGGPLTVNLGGSGAALNAAQVGGLLHLNNYFSTHPVKLLNAVDTTPSGTFTGFSVSVGFAATNQGVPADFQSRGGSTFALIDAPVSGSGDFGVYGSGINSPTGPAGILAASGPLTYTGRTVVSGATLRLADGVSLPETTNLILAGGGVLGTSGTFTARVGDRGPGGVSFAPGGSFGLLEGGGGFAATGGPLTLNLQRASNVASGSPTSFPVHNSGELSTILLMGSPASTHSVTLGSAFVMTGGSGISSYGTPPAIVPGISNSDISRNLTFNANGATGSILLENSSSHAGEFTVSGGLVRLGAGTGATNLGDPSALGTAGARFSGTLANIVRVLSGGAGYTPSITNGAITLTAANGATATGFVTTNASGSITGITLSGTSGRYVDFFNSFSITGAGTPTTPAAFAPVANQTGWQNNSLAGGTLDLNGSRLSDPLSQSNNTTGVGNIGGLVNSNTAVPASVDGAIRIGDFQSEFGGFITSAAFGGPGDITLHGFIYGGSNSGGFLKRGSGKLTLAGTTEMSTAASGSGRMLVSYGGTLALDYTTNNTNKLTNGRVELINSRLELIGNASAPTVQSVRNVTTAAVPAANDPLNASLAINGANSLLLKTSGQNLTFNIGHIARGQSNGAFALGGINQATLDVSYDETAGGTASVNTLSPLPQIPLMPVVASGGSGYADTTTITANTPSGGSPMQVRPIIDEAGTITGLIVVNPGSGYTSAPTFTLSNVGSGSGATITGAFGAAPALSGAITFNGRNFATVTGGKITNAAAGGTSFGPGRQVDLASDTTLPTVSVLGTASAVGNTAAALRFTAPATLNLNGQTLVVAGNNNGQPGPFTNNFNGGILLPADAVPGTYAITNGTIFGGNNQTLAIHQYSTTQTLRIGAVIATSAAGDQFVKAGPGNVEVTSAFNSGGTNYIVGGVWTFNSVGATGTSTVSAASGIGGAGNLRLSNTTIRYAPIDGLGAAGGDLGARSITLEGNATLDASGTGTLIFNNAPSAVSISADRNNTNAAWNLTLTGSGDAEIRGVINLGATTANAAVPSLQTPGFGQVTKTGAGTWTLSGNAGVMQGGLVVNGGAIAVNNANNDAINNATQVTINGGAFNVLSASERVGIVNMTSGSIGGTGALDALFFNLDAGSVTAPLTGDLTGLRKTGAGTLTLAGNSSYKGGTTFLGGTVAVTGNVNSGNFVHSTDTAVSIAGTSTVTTSGLTQTNGSLSVNGTVAGPVTASSATVLGTGTVSSLSLTAGAFSPATIGTAGTFSVTTDSVLGGAGTFTLDIASAALADKIVVGGSLNIADFALVVSDPTSVSGPASWTIATATGGVTGTFSGSLPSGFTIDYLAGSIVLNKAGAAAAEWANPAGGDWNTGANWTTGTEPNAVGAVANLYGSLSPSGSVTLSAPVTVGTLNIDNAGNSYTVSGSTLTLQSATTASVNVATGTHFIDSAVALASDTTVSVASGASLQVNGAVSGGGKLTKADAGILELRGATTYAGDTTVNGGELLLSNAARLNNGAATVVAANAKLTIDVAGAPSGTPIKVMDQASLTINGSSGNIGRVEIGATGPGDSRASALQNVAVVGALSIANDGAPLGSRAYYGNLDLGDNDLVVKNGNVAALSDMVRAWYNGGARNGDGLGTTATLNAFTTLGVMSNDSGFGFPVMSSFDGVSVVAADVLVKFTYLGDTDLNGLIDARDINKVLNGWSNGLAGWQNGDTNYDGVIDGTDFSNVLAAFTGQGGSLAGDGSGGASIPEPAALGLLAAGLPLVTRRRRR